MHPSYPAKSIILAASLLLQLSGFCLRSHGAAGDVDLSFDTGSGVNGDVTALAVQPDGKVIIGGSFSTVRGLARPGLARLNADGSGDLSFNPPTGAAGANAIRLQADGNVLVGNYAGILRLNADGSLDNTFSASMTAFDDYDGVYAIAIQSDGKVLIGGNFTIINGTSRTGIARLNVNGTLDSNFDPGTGAYGVGSIAVQPDGSMFIAGWFQSVNGTNRNYMARLNANGGLDSGFIPGTGPNASIYSMALQPDGKVLIGGNFTAVNGTNLNGIARLNTNGGLDSSFNPGTGPGTRVASMALQPDGKVVVGARFDVANASNLARLNTNGTLDGGFNPGAGADGNVFAVAVQSDGRVLIGGEFTAVQGAIRNHLARLNAGGSLDASFNPGKEISGQVSSVAVQPDGKVLLGGWFNNVQGTSRNGVARLNANGGLDSTFDPGTGAHGNVNAVALQADGKVLIGGSFDSVNGTNRNSVARLNANGSLDPNFQPDVAAINPGNDCPTGYACSTYCETTHVLVQPDGQVLIGGSFVTFVWPQFEGEDVQVLYRYFLGRYNASGSRDSGFNPGTNFSVGYNPMSSLALQPDGKVLVGGYEGISRLNTNATLDPSFNAGTVNSIRSIALQSDGKVLIGGGFSTVQGTNRNRMARLNANGSLDGSFNPGTGVNGAVYAVALQPDGKVLIGSDHTYDGTNFYTITRRNANGSLDAGFNPGSGASGAVRSIALQPDGKVLIGGSFTTVNGLVRPQLARLYGDAVGPSLKIARSNAFVLVSWPVSGPNFQLQESTNLSLPNAWSAVAQPAVTNAGHFSVTVPTTVGRKFFRLKSQ